MTLFPKIDGADETVLAMEDSITHLMGKVEEGREVVGYCIMVMTVPAGGGEGVVQAIYQIMDSYEDQLPNMVNDFGNAMHAEAKEMEN